MTGERRDALAGKAPHHETGRFVQFGSEEDDMSLKLVITLLVAASLLGGAMGAGVALVVDHGKVGPRGPQGAKGPPGPPGIYADVGVLEARIAGLDRRLSRLERR
jgi:hypothetical protein